MDVEGEELLFCGILVLSSRETGVSCGGDVVSFPVDFHPILLMAGKPFNLNFTFALKLFYHVESE